MPGTGDPESELSQAPSSKQPRTSGQGLTYHLCATPSFAFTHTHIHICTYVHTHAYTPALRHCLSIPLCTHHRCTHLHMHTHACIPVQTSIHSHFHTNQKQTLWDTPMCSLTGSHSLCVHMGKHTVCVPSFTFPGWGNEASPGVSRSPVFGESPTWWTFGVYANPTSKPECPWDWSEEGSV